MNGQNLNTKANLYVRKFWYEQDIKTKRLLKIAYKCGYVTGEGESLERFREGMLKGMKDSPSDINDLINKNFREGFSVFLFTFFSLSCRCYFGTCR